MDADHTSPAPADISPADRRSRHDSRMSTTDRSHSLLGARPLAFADLTVLIFHQPSCCAASCALPSQRMARARMTRRVGSAGADRSFGPTSRLHSYLLISAVFIALLKLLRSRQPQTEFSPCLKH